MSFGNLSLPATNSFSRCTASFENLALFAAAIKRYARDFSSVLILAVFISITDPSALVIFFSACNYLLENPTYVFSSFMSICSSTSVAAVSLRQYSVSDSCLFWRIRYIAASAAFIAAKRLLDPSWLIIYTFMRFISLKRLFFSIIDSWLFSLHMFICIDSLQCRYTTVNTFSRCV